MKQTTSLKLSKELKQLGYPQENSEWCWYNCDVFNSIEIGCTQDIPNEDIICSAPTVSELGERFPQFIYYGKYYGDKNKYACFNWTNIPQDDFGGDIFIADTLVDACAKMQIHRINLRRKNEKEKNT